MQIAGFTARRAIIDAVFAKAHVMHALTKRAISVTGAGPLRQVAHHAGKVLGHKRRLARFGGWSNGTMVGELKGDFRQVLLQRLSALTLWLS